MDTPATALPSTINPTPAHERIYIVSCINGTITPLRVFSHLEDAMHDVQTCGTFARVENGLNTLSGDLWRTVDEVWEFYLEGADTPEYIISSGYFVRRPVEDCSLAELAAGAGATA
jgi:hypothetical protein